MGLAFARWKKSAPSIGNLPSPLPTRRSSRNHPPIATATPAPPSATASTRSSASMNSTRTWSSLTPLISVESKLSATLHATRSRGSSSILPTGPIRTAMPCSASSTATCRPRTVWHEATLSRFASGRSVGNQRHPRWIVPRPCAASPIPLARPETLLPSALRRPRAETVRRQDLYWPSLLLFQSAVEAHVVSARHWLRRRPARPRRSRRQESRWPPWRGQDQPRGSERHYLAEPRRVCPGQPVGRPSERVTRAGVRAGGGV